MTYNYKAAHAGKQLNFMLLLLNYSALELITPGTYDRGVHDSHKHR